MPAKLTVEARAQREALKRAEQDARNLEAMARLMQISDSITASSTKAEVMAAGLQITAMKAAMPLNAERELYVEGAKFIVVAPGARMEGIVLFGETNWGGWSRNLEVGEVVECLGWTDGWQTPGVLVPNFAPPNAAPYSLQVAQVWPLAGMWKPWPMPGVLRPLEEMDR